MRERVVITGLGVVSPAGTDLDEFWRTVREGRSTAAEITAFDASELPVRFGCEVPDGFADGGFLSRKEARRMDRFVQFASVGAERALEDAGRPSVDPARAAVVAGTGSGGAQTNALQGLNFLNRGHAGIHPLTVPMAMPNAAAGQIALRCGWRGPNYCVASACATGAHALGEGLRLIRDGSADIVLAGASEACITPFGLAAFASLQALSTRNDDPRRASRPFDLERDGFVMSEGAAFCVLERLRDAERRGARVYCELAGYGRNCDAHHMVMPAQDGAGAADCMRLALEDARLTPADVVQINAHGTATQLNDRAEAAALSQVFNGTMPPVTSSKGALGHMVAAAGAVELAVSCLSLKHGEVPATANFDRADPDAAVPVSRDPRPMGAGAIVSNSFGFGGHNATLVVCPQDR